MIAALVLISGLGALLAADSSEPMPAGAPLNLQIEYRVELPTDLELRRQAAVWIPLPREDCHQRVTRSQLPAGGAVTQDPALGNRFLYFAPHRPTPLAAQLTLTFDITRRAVEVLGRRHEVEPLSLAERARWLEPSPRIPTQGLAREISDRLVGRLQEPRAKVRRLYDHVFEHMTYDKTLPGWGEANFDRACEVGKGNCTDFHGLFLGLVRAQGVPARFEIGLELDPGGRTDLLGAYHCWAWFHDPQVGWAPVDISAAWKRARQRGDYSDDAKFAGFGKLDPYRVSFGVGLDVPTVPASSGAVRFLVDPIVEWSGKRLRAGDPAQGAFRRSWTFKIVPAKPHPSADRRP